jgi:hypothetical protein
MSTLPEWREELLALRAALDLPSDVTGEDAVRYVRELRLDAETLRAMERHRLEPYRVANGGWGVYISGTRNWVALRPTLRESIRAAINGNLD